MRLRAGRMKKIMDLLLQMKQKDTSRTLGLFCPNLLYLHQEEIPIKFFFDGSRGNKV